ncbi:MAG TPA: histidine phosphatase family protein [Anaerolineae bacterium]|nr:histidine phosphatase family protein [Anaerolineae bacterium]HQK12821.1 histidine phosphatase family protein [Anaerolineae bacterium]
MQLYFIRHGQSANNHLWERTGSNVGRHEDPELTSLGRQQAALVAGFLQQADPMFDERDRTPKNVAGFGITHVYCSLMVRAVATGAAIAGALGLPLVGLRDAHETGGIYQFDPVTDVPVGLPGRPRSYFATHYPQLCLPESVDENGWWNRPFEEESEYLPRAQRLVAWLLAQHGDTEDHIVLVTHGGFYNYLIAALLDIPFDLNRWFVLNNVAITRLDCLPERTRIVYMNRTDFLPKALIT